MKDFRQGGTHALAHACRQNHNVHGVSFAEVFGVANIARAAVRQTRRALLSNDSADFPQAFSASFRLRAKRGNAATGRRPPLRIAIPTLKYRRIEQSK
jgi:hypothetical protein